MQEFNGSVSWTCRRRQRADTLGDALGQYDEDIDDDALLTCSSSRTAKDRC